MVLEYRKKNRCGLVFSTAFTDSSPQEAGPRHLGDCRFLGAAAMAGHRHLCDVRFGSRLVYLIKSLPCHLHMILQTRSSLGD